MRERVLNIWLVIVILHIDVMDWSDSIALLLCPLAISYMETGRVILSMRLMSPHLSCSAVSLLSASIWVGIFEMFSQAAFPIMEGYSLTIMFNFPWIGSILLLVSWCLGHAYLAINPALTLGIATLGCVLLSPRPNNIN